MTITLEDLERRVTILESEVRGEAALTRRAFEHIHEMRDDIAILRKHAATSGDELARVGREVGRVGEEVEQLSRDVGRLGGEVEQLKLRVGRLESDFGAFRREFPDIVATTMREVLREHHQGNR